MALGTLTIAAAGPKNGDIFMDLVSFAGDSSYPTGGTVGFQALVRALARDNREVMAVAGVIPGADARHVRYDKTNDKLQVYAPGGAEVANATDLSGTTFRLMVFSR